MVTEELVEMLKEVTILSGNIPPDGGRLATLRENTQELIGELQTIEDRCVEECVEVGRDLSIEAGQRRPSEYTVSFKAAASNVVSLRKQIVKAFSTCAALEVERETARSRASRLGSAEAQFERVKEEVDNLREEIEEWKNNLPENFQQGEKADQLDTCLDALAQLADSLEQVSGWEDVEFPSMMG